MAGRRKVVDSWYLSGRKPQYGAPRWERYEFLRVKGFSKNEARALSKIRTGDAVYVLTEMIRTRQTLLRKADKEGWTRYQFYAAVRSFYKRNNLTSVTRPDGTRVAKRAGRPDVFVWFHRQENKLARQKGWRKGDPDTTRRPKRKTGTRKGRGKGNIKAQKERAVQRAEAHKMGFNLPAGSRVSAAKRREWVFGSGGLVETGRKYPERQDEMRESAKRLGFIGRLSF